MPLIYPWPLGTSKQRQVGEPLLFGTCQAGFLPPLIFSCPCVVKKLLISTIETLKLGNWESIGTGYKQLSSLARPGKKAYTTAASAPELVGKRTATVETAIRVERQFAKSKTVRTLRGARDGQNQPRRRAAVARSRTTENQPQASLGHPNGFVG